MSDFPREPLSTSSEALPPPTSGPEFAGSQAGSGSQVSSSSSSDTGSKVDEAKGEAKQVADTAVASGKDVAATAKDEAKNVAAEAKQQAGSLLDTVRTEVGHQASTSQSRIAEALHGLSKELGSMASSSEESGPLTDLAHQASRRGGEIAHWLQDREPSDVLEEVRSYARRRPGTFLVLCGLAGVVAGRLTRSAVASRTSLDSHDDSGSAGALLTRGADHTASRPDGYATAEVGRGYASVPPADPATRGGAAGPSTGVYGGSLETTEPAAGAGTVGDPTLPGSGYVGTTGTLDPEGDRNR